MIFSFCVKALGAFLLRTIKVRRARQVKQAETCETRKARLRNSMVLRRGAR